MPNISSIVKNVRNIMRNEDPGISGDAQRLEQLGWMIFLKILDDKDQELEVTRKGYKSVVPEELQWRTWATDKEGITGDELIQFISHPTEGLFVKLSALTHPQNPERARIVREVFDSVNNFMKSGYAMRKVINELNDFDFNNSEDRHIFGTIYENILIELRDAGNKGEFYTPRAITQLMAQMTDPKIGEKVLDPAAGTGGFLTAAIDYMHGKDKLSLDQEKQLQKSIIGWEYKPVPFVLGLTNLVLHGIDVPDWHYQDSLQTEYNAIGKKDQVDVILANPPFGAGISDGVETNFPASFRCKESADLFVILILQMLKKGGRCAIVLPDGCITGDGYKSRIREKLLKDCNLHTIVRLPQSTFHPATVSTNLLFFEKGTPTKDIWYYEHRLPEGQKSYSKNKVIQYDEFAPMIKWWRKREETEVAWKVNIDNLKNGFDLDVKNPHEADIVELCPEVAAKGFTDSVASVSQSLTCIKKLIGPVSSSFRLIADYPSAFFFDPKKLCFLHGHIRALAITGKLTESWRAKNPSIEPASELIKRIKAEKAQLIANKKIRKEKPLPQITPEETPFDIPESWEWCRLADLAKKNRLRKHSSWREKCIQ